MKLTFDQAWKVGALLFALGGLYVQRQQDHTLLEKQQEAIVRLENHLTVLEVIVDRIDPIKSPR